jgi:acyl carrier protein
MIKNDVENFIKEVLLDIGIEEEEIKENSYLRDEIGLDSTEVVDLSLAIKKKYGVNINLKEDKKLQEIYNIVLSN